MLCVAFVFTLFTYHALKVKFDSDYRKLSTHEKIHHSYSFLLTCAYPLHFILAPHQVIKHLAVLYPKSPKMLLWLIEPCTGFDIILSCSMVNPYLGVAVACTYPLSFLQAAVVLGEFL